MPLGTVEAAKLATLGRANDLHSLLEWALELRCDETRIGAKYFPETRRILTVLAPARIPSGDHRITAAQCGFNITLITLMQPLLALSQFLPE